MLKELFKDYVDVCNKQFSGRRYGKVRDLYERIEASKSLTTFYKKNLESLDQGKRLSACFRMTNDFVSDEEAASMGTIKQYAAFVDSLYNLVNWRNDNLFGLEDNYSDSRNVIKQNRERIEKLNSA